jgi:hypothetical protein
METSQKKKKSIKANIKHKTFVLEYIANGNNATKAYMKVFEIKNYDSASVLSHKLLRNVKVSEAIEIYYTKLWESKSKEIGKAFGSLLRIASSDIANVVDFEDGQMKVKDFKNVDSSVIKAVSQNVTETANGVNVHTSVVLHDKVKAISELLKVLNMINEKMEIFGDVEIISAKIPEHLISQKINEN